MDDLNAQQIVLLTLLVSFVTSIATGITTVSLLEQAPEPVTQTINRVVEKTVERVVEVDGDNEPTETIVETVIVKEEDLTIEAVEKNSNSIVRIFETANDLERFVGIGIIVADDGEVLISTGLVNEDSSYIGQYPDSNKFNLEITNFGPNYSLLNIPEEQGTPTGFNRVSIGNSDNLKLGQSIIALSGADVNAVTTGIITSLNTQPIESESEDSENQTTQELASIETSVNGTKIVQGAILLNLQGQLVGLKDSIAIDKTTFTPSKKARTYLDSFNEITE
jgi:hypothetical protein